MDITAFYQELDQLFRAGQIDQVEPYLLKQAADAGEKQDLSAALAVLNELIGFYRSQQRYEDAIHISGQALALCGHEAIFGSASHATTLLNSATAYRFAGQPQKALELFSQAETIYQGQLSPTDEHYAGLYNNMSAAYSDIGEYDRSADCLLRAAAIMDALPERVKEAAITHANLAALYSKMQNWSGAKEQIAKACDLLRGIPEAAEQYKQFCSMQEMFSKHPD